MGVIVNLNFSKKVHMFRKREVHLLDTFFKEICRRRLQIQTLRRKKGVLPAFKKFYYKLLSILQKL